MPTAAQSFVGKPQKAHPITARARQPPRRATAPSNQRLMPPSLPSLPHIPSPSSYLHTSIHSFSRNSFVARTKKVDFSVQYLTYILDTKTSLNVFFTRNTCWLPLSSFLFIGFAAELKYQPLHIYSLIIHLNPFILI